jgi:hypothetical protein
LQLVLSWTSIVFTRFVSRQVYDVYVKSNLCKRQNSFESTPFSPRLSPFRGSAQIQRRVGAPGAARAQRRTALAAPARVGRRRSSRRSSVTCSSDLTRRGVATGDQCGVGATGHGGGGRRRRDGEELERRCLQPPVQAALEQPG